MYCVEDILKKHNKEEYYEQLNQLCCFKQKVANSDNPEAFVMDLVSKIEPYYKNFRNFVKNVNKNIDDKFFFELHSLDEYYPDKTDYEIVIESSSYFDFVEQLGREIESSSVGFDINKYYISVYLKKNRSCLQPLNSHAKSLKEDVEILDLPFEVSEDKDFKKIIDENYRQYCLDKIKSYEEGIEFFKKELENI